MVPFTIIFLFVLYQGSWICLLFSIIFQNKVELINLNNQTLNLDMLPLL